MGASNTKVNHRFGELQSTLRLHRIWIALVYVVLGTLYILASSGSVSLLLYGESAAAQALYEIYKGIGFVWFSGAAIYAALYYAHRRELAKYRELLGHEHQQRELEHYERLTEITGGISHDLRNILQLIMIHLEKLSKLEQSEELQQASGLIQEELGRVVEMCDTMTDACSEPLEEEEISRVDLIDFVKSETRLVRPLLEEGKVRITSEVEHAEVEVDTTALHRVLINLLFNAVKSAGQDGEVSIWIGTEDGRPFIRIANSGEPIPVHLIEAVNEEIRDDMTVDRGHGWGLNVVMEAAEQIGARVRAARSAAGTKWAAVFEVFL